MIYQILLIQLCLGTFGIAYFLFFRNSTRFTLNRAILLGIPILSILITFVRPTYAMMDRMIEHPKIKTIPLITHIIEEKIAPEDPSHIMFNTKSPYEILIEHVVSYTLWIYGIGFIISLLLLCYRIMYLIFKHQKANRIAPNTYTLPSSQTAYSFGKSIYIGDQISAKMRANITKHESVHVKQKHYLDLFIYEAYRIFFWFHPAIYYLQKEIRLNHEYLADEAVVTNINYVEYRNQLLNVLFETDQFTFINSFFAQSLLKQRLLMLKRSTSKTTTLIKYFLLFPFFLFFLTASAYIHYSIDPTINDIKVSGFNFNEDIEGCEARGFSNHVKYCWHRIIKNYIHEHLSEVTKNQIQNLGSQMLVLSFGVADDGTLFDIKGFASIPELQRLGEDALYHFPKVTPPTINGKSNETKHRFLIDFEIPEE